MKQNIKNITKGIIIAFLLFTTASCKKFLDEKPDKKLVVPATLRDLQALLDYYNFMANGDPASGEISSDDYYLLNTSFLSTLKDFERRAYTWEKDYIYEPTTNDWSNIYRKVYYANTVLEGLQKIERIPANSAEWDHLKGQALMIRAKAFMQAVNIWSPAYDPATANTDMGIPLRLNTNFNETSIRPSVQETYNQVIKDFTESFPLLPVTPVHPSRASRPAAFGLLARTYLAMANYVKAGLYADSSLRLNNSLMNYNTLNAAAPFPIPQFNAEIMYWTILYQVPLSTNVAKVDTVLYRQYAANDCRKTIFFAVNADGTITFKGAYIGANAAQFSGIATDEMYLVRAEAFARAGNTTSALADLNALLQTRMKTGTFIPVTATGAADALTKILTERRKELLFRGLRWIDLKRLNKEGAGITLKRVINNNTYILPPNDPRYALPIPEYVIDITGMPQNPR